MDGNFRFIAMRAIFSCFLLVTCQLNREEEREEDQLLFDFKLGDSIPMNQVLNQFDSLQRVEYDRTPLSTEDLKNQIDSLEIAYEQDAENKMLELEIRYAKTCLEQMESFLERIEERDTMIQEIINR